ncbi:recombinase family protein [Leptolyngbya sp. FACHB-541]|uniref:fdxN element excision recombinase XisF n=1 Tax=Leptolyngbya sp. FACHB-541 TaxID=2692810 RepID=UPI0016895F24|nr:fdxN element excision recombinase XisF [Leptolyngbya sp. FACHB-541]MBD1995113.1 recombinase family protein [Leptolyngbya sp. FACHB-541]
MIKGNSNRFQIIKVVAEEPESGYIAAYARVSSREQALHTHALEQQLERLKVAGATLIIYEVQKGKKDDRPGLLYTMSLVREKKISEVVVTRLDRLGRTVPLIRKNIAVFQETEVNLRVLDQLIDLKTPQGMFTINLLASLAEMEVDQLSERVRHGKQHSRNQNAACACVPFGYRVEGIDYQLDQVPFLCLLDQRPENYQELSEESDITKLPGITVAQLARNCIDIFLTTKGLSKAVRVISQKYGIGRCHSKKNGNDKIFHWTPAGLKRWLLNAVLQGHTVYNQRRITPTGQRKQNSPEDWDIRLNTHTSDRLLTEQEAEEIKQIIEFNASHLGAALLNYDASNPDTYSPYAYLRSLVYCAECRSKAISKSRESTDRKRRYSYYACRHVHKGCNNLKGTRKELIETAIISHLLQQSVALQSTDLNTPPQPIGSVPTKSEKLQKLEARLSKLEEITDTDPELQGLKQKTRQQIQEELNPFSARALESRSVKEIIQAGNNLVIWHTLSADDRVLIYPRLIDHVTIRNGSVESVVLKD